MNVTLQKGDNRELIKGLADNSIDSIVTDVPYGLGDEPNALDMLSDWLLTGHHEVKGRGFMGKEWDAFVPQPSFWKECLRVLKPGGYLLSFGGTRTFDLIALGLRIAGFEFRDTIMWVYGSGFVKGHDISKAIDKVAVVDCGNCGGTGQLEPFTESFEEWYAKTKDWGGTYEEWEKLSRNQDTTCLICKGTGKVKGAERPIVGDNPNHRAESGVNYEGVYQGGNTGAAKITAPATPEAQQWDGWNVNLTPSYEPILMFRKPLEGTYVENILKWGTGAMNIDACRVPIKDGAKMARNNKEGDNGWKNSSGGKNKAALVGEPKGRWPKNFIHDGSDEVVDLFPETGVSRGGRIANISKTSRIYGGGKGLGVDLPADQVAGDPGYGDTGSAARYFYCAKVSKQERNAGLDGLPLRRYSHDGRDKDIENPYQRNNSVSSNPHPTVKPIALLKYLVRLVTPPGGTLLDPFMGSGSTGCAAVIEGFDFIGFELDAEGLNMMEVAEKRIEYWRKTAWIEEEDVLEPIVDNNSYDNLPMFQLGE